MAQRPIWRGHLRLALVSCPVALYNARHSREALTFHMINPATGNRVRMTTTDAETGQELSRGDLVKGYEFEKNRYLIMEDADFEAARTETSTVMKVDKFVEAGSVDPVYFDGSYYMAPDGTGADDVYGVLREAIAETGRVALSRLTIARRERAVLITPMDGGLAVHTLLEERDLNRASDVFGHALAGKPDPDMVDLAKQLIKRQIGTYDPADSEDRYEARLRTVIDAKMAGQGVTQAAEPDIRQDNVVDLMAALRKSLGQESGGQEAGPQPKSKRPPAKSAPVKPAPMKAASPKPTPAKAAAKTQAKKRA